MSDPTPWQHLRRLVVALRRTISRTMLVRSFAQAILARAHGNTVVMALASKLIRIVWALRARRGVDGIGSQR